jgi:hypothetical protein
MVTVPRPILVAAAFALFAAMPFAGSARAGDNPKTVIFSGIDLAPEGTVAIWSGGIYAFNGLANSGLFVRAFGGNAWYDYQAGVPFGEVDGDLAMADALVGYQFVQNNLRLGVSVGVDYQDHDLSPEDTGNSVRGDETGFKVIADVGTLVAGPWFFDVMGSYSTAFDTYWTRGRVGYEFGKLVIGPEGILFGNEGFDAHRIGGFVQFDMPVNGAFTRTTLAAGYEEHEDNGTFGGREGAYGTLNFAVAF